MKIGNVAINNIFFYLCSVLCATKTHKPFCHSKKKKKLPFGLYNNQTTQLQQDDIKIIYFNEKYILLIFILVSQFVFRLSKRGPLINLQFFFSFSIYLDMDIGQYG